MDLIGCEEDEHGLTLSSGVRIAVIDTGIDSTHPVVSGRILPGFNFVENTGNTDDPVPAFGYGAVNVSMVALLNPSTVALLNPDMVALLNDARMAYTGHGTLVSGLIATVAPGAFIVPIKAFDNSGHASSLTVAKAIRYAADSNVDVINMSFNFDQPSTLIRDALDYAASKGVILVASAGNNDTEATVYPAIHPAVISVASTDAHDRKAQFSNYGPTIAVAAPGEGLISAFPGGHYAAVAGTSFSAALVSAQAALIRSTGTFPPATVLKRIQTSSKKIGTINPGVLIGVGRIRVGEAIEKHGSN
jgi:subtilisin family serine protease